MPQTTVQYRPKRWLTEGQYATTDYRTVEGALENAYNGNTGVLPFGRVSQMVPGTRQVSTLAGAPDAGRLLIVPIYAERYGIELSVLQSADVPTLGYPDEAGVLVEYMTKGDIVMYSEVAVAAGDPVFARHTAGAGANTVLGRVRNAADASLTVAMAGWRFAHSTAGAGLVAVSINGLIKVA